MSPKQPIPFFIVGHPRSGTTLLRYILSNHPHLFVPGETGFIPFLSLAPRRKLSQAEAAKVVNRIAKLNVGWRDLVPDLPAFFESLPSPTAGHMLDRLYRRKIAARGIAGSHSLRWGDKTPGYVHYMPEIAAIFPEAQFIHLIRDGRDAMLSALRKWPDRYWYMDEYYLLANWARSVRAGQRAGVALGAERYLEVHYETLVTEPEQQIRRICAFLGEQFTPELLDHTQLAQEIGVGSHEAVGESINAKSAGRWRRELSPFVKKLANRIAGPTLVAAGYSLADVPALTPGERGRLLGMMLRFRVVDLGRRLLYRMGILTLNRGKRR